MEQSIRCLYTDDTINAMQAYIRYLDKHVMSMDHAIINTEELNRIVKEAVKHMEEGNLYTFKH